MNTNYIVILQEEKEIVDICTNFLGFLQDENEIVDVY